MMRFHGDRVRLPIGLAGVLVACGGGGQGYNVQAPLAGDSRAAVTVVAEGLESPLYVTAPPAGEGVFILERPGRIRIVRDGVLLERPFLDISSRVSTGGERGLLGLAFHPDYGANGRFVVNYSDADGDTRIEHYTVSTDPDSADASSARLMLEIEQPYGNHNGGMIAFGPDGMLYVGMGDGGSAHDPHDHGRNRGTLLGAMLRIDVDGGDPYGVPADNPYVDVPGARAEIWATGLRNPWRFSFDRERPRLFIGDVGQNDWEEINVVDASRPGLDYGWNVMEGRHCFRAVACDQDDLTLPLVEYGHDQGCSVIGGYVYRGKVLPELAGHYFYSDWCRGWLRSFRVDEAGGVAEHTEWSVGNIGNVLSFGQDADGELYIASQNGRVYRLTPAP